jgi:hypothetical protein
MPLRMSISAFPSIRRLVDPVDCTLASGRVVVVRIGTILAPRVVLKEDSCGARVGTLHA